MCIRDRLRGSRETEMGKVRDRARDPEAERVKWGDPASERSQAAKKRQ